MSCPETLPLLDLGQTRGLGDAHLVGDLLLGSFDVLGVDVVTL